MGGIGGGDGGDGIGGNVGSSIGSAIGGAIGGMPGAVAGGVIGGQIGSGGFGGFGGGGNEGSMGIGGNTGAEGPGFGGVGGSASGIGGPGGPDGPSFGGIVGPASGFAIGQSLSKSKQGEQAVSNPQSIAQQIFDLTDPMRQNIVGDLTRFTEGGYNISESPMWGPGRRVVEDQYNVAGQNIMGNMPRGGQLQESLSGLELSRAGGLADLAGRIQQDMLSKAYGISFDSAESAIGSQDASAQRQSYLQANQAQIKAQEDAADRAMMQQLGTSIGTLFASK